MTDDTTPTFSFPAVSRKRITAAFDGGRLSSDGGVMLLAQAERRLGIAERLAGFIPDRRTPTRVRHAVADMIRAPSSPSRAAMRIATTSARCAPIRRSSSPAGTCPRRAPIWPRSRRSRAWRTPRRSAMPSGSTYALVDQWMESYATPPDGVVLDIHDTCDVIHGHQQLSLFIYVTWNPVELAGPRDRRRCRPSRSRSVFPHWPYARRRLPGSACAPTLGWRRARSMPTAAASPSILPSAPRNRSASSTPGVTMSRASCAS